MRKNGGLKMVFGLLIVCCLAILSGFMGTPVKAADNGKINVKTVHSYEELEEVLDGDDAFYTFSGTSGFVQQYRELDSGKIESWDNYTNYWVDGTQIFKVEEDLTPVDESWIVEIAESGWLIVYDYNDNLREYFGHDYKFDDNGSSKNVYSYSRAKNKNFCFTYLYSNKLKTKPVDRVTEKAQLINGQYYKFLDCERYYVQKGTYYLSYAGGRAEWSHCLLSAVFLPAKDLISVKNIEYNDDFTEAVVTFKPMNNSWVYAGTANGKLDSDKALGDKSYWSKYYMNPPIYPDYPKEQVEEFESLLKNGWTIKENGDYSLYYKNGDGAFGNYEGIVTFTIDKIGSGENEVEAKSVKLNKKKLTLKKGASSTLKATLKPADTTDKTLTWTSSNAKVATVDKSGKVTAKKKGTCVITVTTVNGKKAKCKITVKK